MLPEARNLRSGLSCRTLGSLIASFAEMSARGKSTLEHDLIPQLDEQVIHEGEV